MTSVIRSSYRSKQSMDTLFGKVGNDINMSRRREYSISLLMEDKHASTISPSSQQTQDGRLIVSRRGGIILFSRSYCFRKDKTQKRKARLAGVDIIPALNARLISIGVGAALQVLLTAFRTQEDSLETVSQQTADELNSHSLHHLQLTENTKRQTIAAPETNAKETQQQKFNVAMFLPLGVASIAFMNSTLKTCVTHELTKCWHGVRVAAALT